MLEHLNQDCICFIINNAKTAKMIIYENITIRDKNRNKYIIRHKENWTHGIYKATDCDSDKLTVRTY